MRCIGVHIACMTSGGRLSKRIMAEMDVGGLLILVVLGWRSL